MADYPDLDRLVEEATFFPGLNVRLAGLRTLQFVAEEQLNVARRLAIVRMQENHKQLDRELHAEDRACDLKELEQHVTLLLPKLTRGGLLFAVWSIFERTAKDIASRAAAYVGEPLNRDYFKNGGLLDRLEGAILKSSHLVALPNPEQKLALRQLAAVRHVLIHHDGRVEEIGPVLSPLGRSGLDALGVHIERDYDYEYIVPGQPFIAKSIEVVHSTLHELAHRVFEKLVPPCEPTI